MHINILCAYTDSPHVVVVLYILAKRTRCSALLKQKREEKEGQMHAHTYEQKQMRYYVYLAHVYILCITVTSIRKIRRFETYKQKKIYCDTFFFFFLSINYNFENIFYMHSIGDIIDSWKLIVVRFKFMKQIIKVLR